MLSEDEKMTTSIEDPNGFMTYEVFRSHRHFVGGQRPCEFLHCSQMGASSLDHHKRLAHKMNSLAPAIKGHWLSSGSPHQAQGIQQQPHASSQATPAPPIVVPGSGGVIRRD